MAVLVLPGCTLPRNVISTSDGGPGMDVGTTDASCTTPTAETCNEADDDCDGIVDEGFDLATELANCGSCGNACVGGDHGAPTCASGTCGLTCDAAFLDCNGVLGDGCEASRSDARTCGSCANDCTATASPLCMDDGAGSLACVASCTAPTELCGASCVDTTTSVTNCGGCGMACPSRDGSSVSCVASACTYACMDGFGDCDGMTSTGCETSTRTATDCGTCGTPCTIGGATATCATGTCAFVACSTGLENCGGAVDCETPTDTLTDCGGCGIPCTRANAAATCPGGTCTLGACNPGFDDCDGAATNGCEADLASVATCGACGRSCAAGEICRAGGCTSPRVIVEVGAGSSFSCARTADGRIYCWGENGLGQLGNGGTTDSDVPVQVPGITNAVDLAVGREHACVVRTTGAVACWGENARHQVGDDAGTAEHTSPFDVPGISDARSIAAGAEHTCAVRATGAVSCWGRNDQSQLGTAGGDRGTPMDVSGGLGSVVQVDAGGKFNCAVRRGGGVVCWGDAAQRQLGDGGTTDRVIPVPVGIFADALHVSCGSDFACVVHSTGVVDCWGANDQGQLGDGMTAAARGTIEPVMGLPATGAAELTCGTDHACVRTGGGALYCWGANSGGQLGDASFMDRLTAVSVAPAILTTAAAGQQHTCAASATTVYCWGSDVAGELGNGAAGTSNVPVTVVGLPPPT